MSFASDMNCIALLHTYPHPSFISTIVPNYRLSFSYFLLPSLLPSLFLSLSSPSLTPSCISSIPTPTYSSPSSSHLPSPLLITPYHIIIPPPHLPTPLHPLTPTPHNTSPGKKQRDEIRTLENQLLEARRREVDNSLLLARQASVLEEKLGNNYTECQKCLQFVSYDMMRQEYLRLVIDPKLVYAE